MYKCVFDECDIEKRLEKYCDEFTDICNYYYKIYRQEDFDAIYCNFYLSLMTLVGLCEKYNLGLRIKPIAKMPKVKQYKYYNHFIHVCEMFLKNILCLLWGKSKEDIKKAEQLFCKMGFCKVYNNCFINDESQKRQLNIVKENKNV